MAVAASVTGLLPEDRYDRQPLALKEGAAVFVGQCRLDDRGALAAELGLRHAGEMADSELLCAAYERWGADCLHRVYGDFAFAVCRPRERRVFAAVDPLGRNRLFYAAAQGRLVMATQLAALRAYLHGELAVNEDALGLLGAARLQPGETGYLGIQYLPGGHTLTWHGSGARVDRWWQPETAPHLHLCDTSEYVEMAGSLLQQAVRSCLRSTTPITSMLSGGLDSGLLTAMAARELAGRGEMLSAYTAAPNPLNPALQRRAWDADDAPYAAATAARWPNLVHRVLRTEERVTLEWLPELWERSAIPVRNGANHVWIDSIARAARASGSRVLLAGAHGNHGISHTGAGAVAELLRRLQWGAAWRVSRQLHRSGERAAWKSLAGAALPQAWFDAVRERMFPGGSREAGERDYLSDEFRREHTDKLQTHRTPQRSRATFARRATAPLQVWAADPLPQWGVELRDPTADRRLLETLLAMPLDAFVSGGRMRGLARAVGTGLLPDVVRLRRTQGQQAADYAAVMARSARRYHAAVNRMAESAGCRHIFDLPALHEGIRAVEAGSRALFHSNGIDRVVGAGLFLATGGEAAGMDEESPDGWR